MTKHPEKFAKLVTTLSQFDARQLEAVEEAMERIACLDCAVAWYRFGFSVNNGSTKLRTRITAPYSNPRAPAGGI